MTKVVLKDGVFRPLDSLPADWEEGMEFDVTRVASTTERMDGDEWMDAVERAAAEIDPEDMAHRKSFATSAAVP